MEFISQIILVAVLILINGFFAASEYAIVAVRKTRIDELVKRGDITARLLQKALEKREDYISATQLGTTMVSLILGWVGEPIIAGIFSSIFSFLPNGAGSLLSHSFSIVSAFILLTFLSIIMGELVPKTIAIQRAEIVSLILIAPLTLFAKIFKPFVFFLNKSANAVLRLIGLETPFDTRLVYTKEELKIILNQIGQSGIVNKEEVRILENALKLADKQIRWMMTPRSAVLAINGNLAISQIGSNLDQRYSRFPVYKDSLDNIIGFIHVKDVYRLVKTPEKNKKIIQTDILRKVISIPEIKKANEVLFDMRKKHVHLAVAYDEYGIMVGIVTLEDIIESLVGDIQDEFDKPISFIQRNSDGSYTVDGNAPMEIIQKRFHLPIKGQSYTTIGGLIFGLLGREPRYADKISVGHLVFKVESIGGKRIKKLLLQRENPT
ncbi:hypothetical protein A2954_01065 [Candidatus Roizmanbacteria bacterium RIFCSPLOWO2_01_FULL_37_12]|uniref:Hemolysin n=1 Tax=Candidatus Roizmanbacteria bacterium RIFCSPLOWO2_01_FULL_37_12 TaxID=1802056 RepID=A0A1F7IGD1_9BACT|nr:MAG: hypothetical protein A2954_01065 [Candidatus Roizmanbacteria bacterium RIFCSPLOWO2_01_FULL_37_12]